MENKNKKYSLWILLFIIALAFFLRIVNIENTPPGVYPDEAVNGQDALRALNSGKFEWFYPDNQGREGLFMNLIALCFKFFGVSILTLKLPAIIFGTLTVFGVYLLAKELFQKERIALISSFLTAVSFWPLNFSRISFRANMLPFILVFSFYFIFRGLRTKKTSDFIWAGLFFGAGVHTYIAFRIAPLILILLFPILLLSYENFLKIYWKKILVFLLFTILAAAPMLYTLFVAHPEYFESRSENISIFSPAVNKGNLPATFLKSLGLSLVKYNFWGDQNWRHNFPPYPILDPLTGIAFLFGIIYSFIRLSNLLLKRLVKKTRDFQINSYALLIGWFFVMLVPEFLTAEGLPHALRAIGTIPPVFIFSGLTFDYLMKRSEKGSYAFREAFSLIIIVSLLVIGTFNVVKYHYIWSGRIETARSFEKVLMNVSREIQKNADGKIYVITGTMQRIPIRLFNLKVPADHFLYPNEADKIKESGIKNPLIFMTEKNDETITSLKTKFINLNFEEVRDGVGISYYVLR
jgi:4-amino-4-deoxy-L-arabinose transferase-like glycosyltransferase